MALTGTALKSLLSGKHPDGDAWGSLATAVLQAVLADQAMTQQVLARIEERLERIERQPYENSLRDALSRLEAAAAPWRAPADREMLLWNAHSKLSEACAAAPDAGA
jgi:hypothetical protein